MAGAISDATGCGHLDHMAALFAGLTAGVIYYVSSYVLVRLQFDDPVQAT